MPGEPERGAAHAFLAAAGMFLSRISGLVRQRVLAHYLGASPAAAAFQAALRIPNLLQNLLGEGVLSASFIPVYAELVGKPDGSGRELADRVASAVFGLLTFATSLLCAVGIAATPLLVDLIAPGFHGETRELAIHLVRVVFPGIGLLVLSAWCLGILNSHHRFFLPYVAPVLWNSAIITALLVFGPGSLESRLAEYAAWGVVAGSALQLAVQLPAVMALLGRFRPSLSLQLPAVRLVLRSFAAVVVGKGVVQLSAYVDTAYATMISTRALAVLSYAQMLYLLPVSLFGMSVAAVQLASMSRSGGEFSDVRDKMAGGLAQMAFFVVPSAAALLLLGDVVTAGVLQTGRFDASQTRYCWYLLMGSSVGLLAQTMARLYANAFYALKDPRTPLRFAVVRVSLAALVAYFAVTRLPSLLGAARDLAAVAITAVSGLAAWLEYALLRRTLAARTGGDVGVPAGRLPRLWAAALVAGGLGLGVKAALAARFGAVHADEWGSAFLPMPRLHPIAVALAVLGVYGTSYFALTHALGVPQSAAIVRRLLGRLTRR